MLILSAGELKWAGIHTWRLNGWCQTNTEILMFMLDFLKNNDFCSLQELFLHKAWTITPKRECIWNTMFRITWVPKNSRLYLVVEFLREDHWQNKYFTEATKISCREEDDVLRSSWNTFVASCNIKMCGSCHRLGLYTCLYAFLPGVQGPLKKRQQKVCGCSTDFYLAAAVEGFWNLEISSVVQWKYEGA